MKWRRGWERKSLRGRFYSVLRASSAHVEGRDTSSLSSEVKEERLIKRKTLERSKRVWRWRRFKELTGGK